MRSPTDCAPHVLACPVAADRLGAVRSVGVLFRGVSWLVAKRERVALGPSAPNSGMAGGRPVVLLNLLPVLTKALKDFVAAARHVSRIDVEVRRDTSACLWLFLATPPPHTHQPYPTLPSPMARYRLA
jgi:hypothetical protein